MSGGLYNRIKTWGPTDTVIGTDLNAEFDNVLNNFIPTMMQGYSVNAAQMQVQTNPGTVGAESLATALSGELERIRFTLAAITGNTYWYQSPAASISTLNSALGATTIANSITSGRILSTSSQPVFLVPSGSTNTVTLKATTVPFVYKIAGTTYTVSADTTLGSLTLAAAAGAATQCTVNDPTVLGGAETNLLGENGSVITVNNMGSAISNLIGTVAAFKTAGSEYFFARVESSTQLTQVSRGYFFQSNDTLFSRGTMTNADTLTLAKIAWIYISTAGALSANYNIPNYSGTAPTSPNPSDYWFDQVNNVWKTYIAGVWTVANQTLIGMVVTNASATIGARSYDLFKGHSDLNTIELFVESTTQVRSRYIGGQIAVYGTTLQFTESFIQWNTGSNMDSGQTFSASTWYYFYMDEKGNTYISNIPPFDRRPDLKGFYHPLNTWRCLGYAYANGSTQFNTLNPECESFFRSDDQRNTSRITAAVARYPLPYAIQSRQEAIEANASGGALTQVLLPPSQWKGRRFLFVKTGTDYNQVTLQAFGVSVLSTTCTTTLNSATISVIASTTGLVSGQTYLISGPGIQPGSTVIWTSGTTATISNVAYAAGTLSAIVFATVPNINTSGIDVVGIQNQFTYPMVTPGESVELYSDGYGVHVMARNFPQAWINGGVTTLTSSGAGVVKGTMVLDAFWFRRDKSGTDLEFKIEFMQSAAGTVGVGDYRITIPSVLSGQTFDTKRIVTDATAYGAAYPTTTKPSLLGYGFSYSASAQVNTQMVYAQDSTALKVVYVGGGLWSAGFLGLSNAAVAVFVNGKVPMTNWGNF